MIEIVMTRALENLAKHLTKPQSLPRLSDGRLGWLGEPHPFHWNENDPAWCVECGGSWVDPAHEFGQERLI